MKPFYTKATTNYDSSVTIRYDEQDVFYPHWHYHNEYEIVYIHKSHGIRYVGDNISPYKPGELILLGSRLPHTWITSEDNKIYKPEPAACTVIHIQKKFIHNDFFALGLMKEINALFERSTRGVNFVGITGIEVLLNRIQENKSTERVLAVMALLAKLSKHKNYELLSGSGFQKAATIPTDDRLSLVHDFLANHFREQISLNSLADMANMTPQAFCNFFKRKTNKTVFTFINDLKIGYSCKLLIERDLNVSQIAALSGYNNTTFYNRKFKEKMKLTPKEYRSEFSFK